MLNLNYKFNFIVKERRIYMDLTYTAGRKLFEKTIDFLLKYLNDENHDQKERLLKLVDWAQTFMGDIFQERYYNEARKLILDEDGKWMQFLETTLKETDPHVLKTHALNLGYESSLYGLKKIHKMREKHNCNVPWAILMDPTSACNLHCTGCWATEYDKVKNLTFEEMDDIINQGKELGTHFYIFTGGEPLVRKHDIIKLCEKHNDCAFHAFTNGTLVDEKFCEDMQRVGNLSFAISVEGFKNSNDSRRGEGTFDKVMDSMDLLKEHGLLFGTSICYTSKNYKDVTSDEFYDLLISKGAKFSWYFHYMPVGNDASVELLPNAEEREYVYRQIRKTRALEGGKPIFLMDFQNDGRATKGCIAGGKNYLHINSNGDVEPCVFIHFSGANIRDVSLLKALKQPLFMEYKEKMPFNENHFMPCPMLENPDIIVDMVKKSGAKSTYLNSPESAEDLAAKTKPYAEQWNEKADELWDEILEEQAEKINS
jgi:MoaA/NifB/PqqE/SkfB family radical SAM enzyme